MAKATTNPDKDMTAIPLNPAPEVHPLPNCDPIPNMIPPRMAKTILVLEVILGECSNFNFKRPAKAPEMIAPMITPIISKTNQVFIGLCSDSAADLK